MRQHRGREVRSSFAMLAAEAVVVRSMRQQLRAMALPMRAMGPEVLPRGALGRWSLATKRAARRVANRIAILAERDCSWH